MKLPLVNRRRALQSTLAWAGAAICIQRGPRAWGFASPNARPRLAAIGTGSRWCQRATGIDAPHGSAPSFIPFGDYVAVCDVDADRLGLAGGLVKEWSGKAPEAYGDYRQIIDRDDVDVIHISTPDHWHAKMAIEAMLAGKDVYCEKPMTLTIAEGRQMCEVCRKTGRVVQIGTQQRSDEPFLTALAIIRDGRIGDIRKAICSIGGGPTSPVIPKIEAPRNLDWNQWLGPAPFAAYRYLAGDNGETASWSRCHYEFRWWYEYSGGKLTDWGAHHVDIATWAMLKESTGPTLVEPLMVKHPVPFSEGFPTDDSQYNTATEFLIKATYADGMELEIRHDGDNGILFEGTEGRLLVNRGKVTGAAVDDLAKRPLPEGARQAVYKGKEPTDHFRNFFEAVVDRSEPISDVFSHHRALTTCHLAGIAARLGRSVRWSPEKEHVIDDAQAESFVAREPREGFQTEA